MSASFSRFTVSIPTKLLERADRVLRQPDEGRSGLVRRLLEEALRQVEEGKKVEEYIRGYREQPQTEDEVGWAMSPEILAHFEDLPWDDAAR